LNLKRPGAASAVAGLAIALLGRLLNVMGETNPSPGMGMLALTVNSVALGLVVLGFARIMTDEYRARKQAPAEAAAAEPDKTGE
jgi:hypothetical protein